MPHKKRRSKKEAGFVGSLAAKTILDYMLPIIKKQGTALMCKKIQKALDERCGANAAKKTAPKKPAKKTAPKKPAKKTVKRRRRRS
tara:strand:+ start:276 stop:533 length:258 start_codon:yes stop_codon:yes gene_type:complete